MDELKMIYKSAVLERETTRRNPHVNEALSAAWGPHWREDEVMRIEGQHGEQMDSTTIMISF